MLLRKFLNLRKLLRKNKALFLAYDQGIEHGPTDFNDMNVDPRYIISIAKTGGFNAVIFQKGVAEKYISEIKASRVHLIVKLNGKTSLLRGDPISKQLCSVEEAMELGAVGVGYTIYIGSIHEEKMLSEFSKIQDEAHKRGLPVIAWIYPRGKSVEGKKEKELLAYATRTGLEVGADIIKVHWDAKNKKDLEWAVQSAGKARVVIAGGSKLKEKQLLKMIREAKSVGVSGVAIGRNVWQSEDPIKISEKIKEILFGR